jgi:formamidase
VQSQSGSRRVAVDVAVSLLEEPANGHNRWHPDIPPVLEVDAGDTVVFDVRDGTDVQIGADSTSSDVPSVDLDRTHPLTGPVTIRGAEPGDLLDVEIIDIVPARSGYTIVLPGLGALGHRFQEPFLVKWDLADGVARSSDIPGVAIPGAPFLGVMGIAPSRERMRAYSAREQALFETGALVLPPEPHSAVPGDGPSAAEGLRTIPPREAGGNLDIKQLVAGSRVSFAVDVPGALFSVGDPHFAQGDGESCAFAIETAAQATLRFSLRKAAELAWLPSNPVIEFTSGDATPRRYVATTGFPIQEDGTNRYLDTTLAAQRALDELVNYLVAERGLTANAAYVLVSVAADLRINEIVNVPNALVSAALPLDIFEHHQHR